MGDLGKGSMKVLMERGQGGKGVKKEEEGQALGVVKKGEGKGREWGGCFD